MPAVTDRAEARGCNGPRKSVAERTYPSPEVRGGGQEELPPCPRSDGCMVAGGWRGAIPRSRSGGAAVRRYPSSKLRSSSCSLLEQP